MENNRNKTKEEEKEKISQPQQKEPRSGAFNEPRIGEEKSTFNPEEEADLEQERKEAMTERD